jgi:glyoxylase-like metal-dependent hydrolase (beta-lactamase superfamily II)
MVKITEIADGIYRIETPVNGVQFHPTAFLIKDAETLIEPGPAICIPPIQQALNNLNIKNLRYIIPTHIHMDHAGGTGALAQLHPEAKVLVHPRGAKHAIDPSRLVDSIKMVWGEDFEKNFGAITSVPESQIMPVDDGEVIHVADRNLQFVYTPGHAPHHISIFDHKTKGLFCGEAFGMPGHQLPPAAPMSFDLESYISTIEKAQCSAMDVRMLIYSHGGVENEPKKCMTRALENARAIRDIVLNALKQGKKRAEIGRIVGDHIKKLYGIDDINVDDHGFETIAAGYMLYFEKNENRDIAKQADPNIK